MAQKLIVGNWKMNGSLRSNAARFQVLAGEVNLTNEVAVLVPFVYLAQAKGSLTGSAVVWGAQDVSNQTGGAFTGDVSAEMLADFACRYVLVGHSERRQYHAETDTTVADKFQNALYRSITPILCVGESSAERQAGQTEAVVVSQLNAVLDSLQNLDPTKFVVAYEPVWAIGTGTPATLDDIKNVHAVLRERLNEWDSNGAAVRLLYGGSVNAENVASILPVPNVDGVLVGSASLETDDFVKIIHS